MEFDLLQAEHIENTNKLAQEQLDLIGKAASQLILTDAKVTEVFEARQETENKAIKLKQEGNALERNKDVLTSERMKEVLPDYMARLTDVNKAVQETERLVLSAVADYKKAQNNASTTEGKIGTALSNVLFGSSTLDATRNKLKQAEELYNSTVKVRDDLEVAYTDTLTVLKNKTENELSFIHSAEEQANKLAVLEGEKAKQELQLRKINSHQDTKAKLSKLSADQLTVQKSLINTAYQMKLARYKYMLDMADRQEDKLVKKLTYFDNKLTRGSVNYSRLTTSLAQLPNVDDKLINEAELLGDIRLELDDAILAIQDGYRDVALGNKTEADLTPILDKYTELTTKYTNKYSAVSKAIITNRLQFNKESQEQQQQYLNKINNIVTRLELPQYPSIKAIETVKKQNPQFYSLLNTVAVTLPDGADPSELVESTEPQVFLSNVDSLVSTLGLQRARKLVGDDVFEVYSTIKQSFSDTEETTLITGSKAIREAKLSSVALRDSRVAQLNAFNPSAPTNVFTDIFSITAEDFDVMKNNATAKAIKTILKGDGNKLTSDNLITIISGLAKEAKTSTALAKAVEETSALLKAVYASKVDFRSLGLGVSDSPIMSLRYNKTGEVKNKEELIRLDSPTSLLKFYLQQQSQTREAKFNKWLGINLLKNDNAIKASNAVKHLEE